MITKLFISHVIDTSKHLDNFPIDENGEHILPYTLVTNRAYVYEVFPDYIDEDGVRYPVKKRSKIDLQSVALICVDANYEPVAGQTLYPNTPEGLYQCAFKHPKIDYKTLGSISVNGKIYPDKSLLTHE
jgi:hypothetical protein